MNMYDFMKEIGTREFDVSESAMSSVTLIIFENALKIKAMAEQA